MEWTPASGEQERHNVTVITVGSRNYSLCSVSSSLSHATLEQPIRTLAIKWEVNIFIKKSSCVVYACIWLIHCVFILPSCVVYYCVLIYCVSMYPAYICIFLHESEDGNTTYITRDWVRYKMGVNARQEWLNRNHTKVFQKNGRSVIFLDVNVWFIDQL